MTRLTAALLCAAGLSLGGAAMAQITPGSGPIDISANELELVDAQHLAVWRGEVDALQGKNRLRADVVNIYFNGKPTPGSSGSGASPGRNWGRVDHMVAEGHVYFISPTQNARGDHAVYELGPDTVTLTGDVIVEQGQSVIHGQKLIIDVRTGHAQMASGGQTHSPSGRVRGIFYTSEQQSGGAAGRQP